MNTTQSISKNTRLVANVLRTEMYEANVKQTDPSSYKEVVFRETYARFPEPTTDELHERYLAIQRERLAEPPKETHAEKERRLLEANTKQQERLQKAIAQTEAEIAKKVPGTLRELKKDLKELKEELRVVKVCRGTLHNGGVW
jgi:hypothetical protein